MPCRVATAPADSKAAVRPAARAAARVEHTKFCMHRPHMSMTSLISTTAATSPVGAPAAASPKAASEAAGRSHSEAASPCRWRHRVGLGVGGRAGQRGSPWLDGSAGSAHANHIRQQSGELLYIPHPHLKLTHVHDSPPASAARVAPTTATTSSTHLEGRGPAAPAAKHRLDRRRHLGLAGSQRLLLAVGLVLEQHAGAGCGGAPSRPASAF